MELWVQNKIITYILAPLAKIPVRFSEKTRDRIFVACGFMIFLMTFIFQSRYTSFRYFYAYAFDCLMLGIMILCTLRQDMKPIVFDKKLLLSGAVLGVSTLLSAIFLDTDYFAHAMLCLIAYPVVYIVWNNIDVTHIFWLLLKISKLSFLFYFLVQFLFFPIEMRKYNGFVHNVNNNAFFLVLFACCFFLELLIGKKHKRDYVFLLICYGLNGALLFCTNSRSGTLAVLLSHGFLVVLLLIIFKDKFWKVYTKKIIALVLAVLLFIPITIFLFQIPRFCVDVIQQIFFQMGTDQSIESPFSSFVRAFINIVGTWGSKTSIEGKDIVRISAGRIDIWKAYLMRLRLTGHNKKDAFLIVSEGVDHVGWTAHMLILQYAYQFGILAGLSLLWFNLIAGIKSIRYALKYGRHEIIALFPFVISTAFGVISLLTSVGSFTVFIVLYYFLVQAPLITEGLGERSNA